MAQYHVIDPVYFWDAIEMFSFDFDWYAQTGFQVNDLGKRVNAFEKRTIRGSLQSQGTTLQMNKELNTEQMEYEFYCKSVYRISIGDFLFYKNRWLHVESVRDFDEWGCRSASCRMINLNNYKDFQEYLKYLQGETII